MEGVQLFVRLMNVVLVIVREQATDQVVVENRNCVAVFELFVRFVEMVLRNPYSVTKNATVVRNIQARAIELPPPTPYTYEGMASYVKAVSKMVGRGKR